jgi:hypothetical protein
MTLAETNYYICSLNKDCLSVIFSYLSVHGLYLVAISSKILHRLLQPLISDFMESSDAMVRETGEDNFLHNVLNLSLDETLHFATIRKDRSKNSIEELVNERIPEFSKWYSLIQSRSLPIPTRKTVVKTFPQYAVLSEYPELLDWFIENQGQTTENAFSYPVLFETAIYHNQTFMMRIIYDMYNLSQTEHHTSAEFTNLWDSSRTMCVASYTCDIPALNEGCSISRKRDRIIPFFTMLFSAAIGANFEKFMDWVFQQSEFRLTLDSVQCLAQSGSPIVLQWLIDTYIFSHHELELNKDFDIDASVDWPSTFEEITIYFLEQSKNPKLVVDLLCDRDNIRKLPPYLFHNESKDDLFRVDIGTSGWATTKFYRALGEFCDEKSIEMFCIFDIDRSNCTASPETKKLSIADLVLMEFQSISYKKTTRESTWDYNLCDAIIIGARLSHNYHVISYITDAIDKIINIIEKARCTPMPVDSKQNVEIGYSSIDKDIEVVMDKQTPVICGVPSQEGTDIQTISYYDLKLLSVFGIDPRKNNKHHEVTTLHNCLEGAKQKRDDLRKLAKDLEKNLIGKINYKIEHLIYQLDKVSQIGDYVNSTAIGAHKILSKFPLWQYNCNSKEDEEELFDYNKWTSRFIIHDSRSEACFRLCRNHDSGEARSMLRFANHDK